MNEGPTKTPEQSEAERRLAPRIYVASLSDYNAGRLHGRWIDAARPAEELHADIQAMLERSPEPIAEEWAIHDYEGFGLLRLDEYEDLATVSAVATGIMLYGPPYAAWASLESPTLERLARFQEAFQGTWPSVVSYADDYFDNIGAAEALAQLPDWLQAHIKLDIEGFARDLQLGGDIIVVEDGDQVHIFDGYV